MLTIRIFVCTLFCTERTYSNLQLYIGFNHNPIRTVLVSIDYDINILFKFKIEITIIITII